jgi:predicted esterase
VTYTETELAAQSKEGLPGLLSVPDGTGAVPVLLFLHGRGEAAVGLDGSRQPLHAVGNNEAPIACPAAQERFALVAPQAATSLRANIWAGLLTPVAELLERARQLLGERDDSRLFVCGFSQGAFAAVEYAGANAPAVVAWVGVDAARRVPVEPTLVASAARLPHLLLAGPAGFRRNALAPDTVAPDGPAPGDLLARDEIQLADLGHVDMCREVYSGRFRLDNGDSVYDWLLRQGR